MKTNKRKGSVMPRPENPELRERIVNCAHSLFREKGYKSSSYADIASAAGITKALLQYHFPKKSRLATEVMTNLLDEAAKALGVTPPAASHATATYRDLYQIGQVFFAHLLDKDGYRPFIKDVVSDLDLIDDVLVFNLDWALRYALDDNQRDDREVAESLVIAMGGFYSLLHYNLVHGYETDIAKHLGEVMRKVMLALGFTKEEISEAIDGAQLDKVALAKTLQAIK